MLWLDREYVEQISSGEGKEMKKSIKILWLVIAFAFVCGITLMAAGFFAGASLSLYADSGGIHPAGREAGVMKVEASDLAGMERIKIDVDASNIRIIGADRNDVEISYSRGEPVVEITGGELKISQSIGRRLHIFNLGFDFNRDDTVTVYCKESELLKEINVKSDFGDVRLQNINADAVVLNLSAGSIRMNDVKTNSLSIDNDFGDVRMSGVTANDSRIEVSAGNVDARGDFGSTQINNDFGEITFHTIRPMDQYRYSFSVDLGDVTINGSKAGKGINADVNQTSTVGDGPYLKFTASFGSINANFESR